LYCFVKGKIEVKGNGVFQVYVNGNKKKDKSTFDSLPKAVSFEFGFEPMTSKGTKCYLNFNELKTGNFTNLFNKIYKDVSIYSGYFGNYEKEVPDYFIYEDKMIFFRDYLTNNGIMTTIRKSRGEDIFAACGMLSTLEKQKNKENQL
jgi:hypothetical protein